MSEIEVLQKELNDKNEFIKNILHEMKDSYEASDELKLALNNLKSELQILTRLIK